MNSRHSGNWFLRVALIASLAGASLACGGKTSADADHPSVAHVTLPMHRAWRVVSVQPYEGLEEVELVKIDWPTATEPTVAFTLTREGLKTGDQICLDHVREIDTYWAHPVPEGGCAALKGRPR
jgi:hypothetical protein